MNKLLILFLLSSNLIAKDYLPSPLLESDLEYEINLKALNKGDFQYFFSLLKPEKKNTYKNLNSNRITTSTKKILDTFLPLDSKNLWDTKENNYLAVAKMNYILPTQIKNIRPENLDNKEYLQYTMPKYSVTKKDNYYHVSGSILTPDFDLYLQFLDKKHPYLSIVKDIDPQKIAKGKMKVSYQYQDNFGRVMMFKTAKMATAISIYQETEKDQTLVTQYILSYIINVPTKSLIKNSMVENLQDVVFGSRKAALNF